MFSDLVVGKRYRITEIHDDPSGLPRKWSGVFRGLAHAGWVGESKTWSDLALFDATAHPFAIDPGSAGRIVVVREEDVKATEEIL